MSLLLQMDTLAQKVNNMTNTRTAKIGNPNSEHQNIIEVTCIEYGISLRDQKYATGGDTLTDIRERLPTTVITECPDYIADEVTEVLNGFDEQQLNDYLYDKLSDEIGWLVDSAIIYIPHMRYRVFHSFRSNHNFHTWTDQYSRNEISNRKLLSLIDAFEDEWAGSCPAKARFIEWLKS